MKSTVVEESVFLALHVLYEHGISLARVEGLSAQAIRKFDHTGRHGAFAHQAAEEDFLTIKFGEGSREKWRQVAPDGGVRPMLPSNPYRNCGMLTFTGISFFQDSNRQA